MVTMSACDVGRALLADVSLLPAGVSLLAQAAPVDPNKLDPVTRARLMMALTGVVLLGLLLVIVAMLGARWLRRLVRPGASPKRPEIEDKWYAKPLVESPRDPET
jgi:hypothetical protein